MSSTPTPPPARAAAATGPVVDATRLLADDHAEVRALFAQYRQRARDGASGDDRQPLAEEICNLLTVHAAIEEEIFYPAARVAGVDSALLDEAEVEHASAKDLVAQVRDMAPDEPLYDARVVVLGEYVDHHAGEEEDELFAKCRAAGLDLGELGRRLAARKDELMSEIGEGMDLVG